MQKRATVRVELDRVMGGKVTKEKKHAPGQSSLRGVSSAEKVDACLGRDLAGESEIGYGVYFYVATER